MNAHFGASRGPLGWLLPRLDLPLLAALLLLSAIGLLTLHSATSGAPALFSAQAARFAAGFAALWVIALIPPQQLRLWTPWLFAASLVLLLLVPVFGTGRSGRHWLNLGVFFVQPGELLKLTLPMMVAWLLHRGSLPPGWGTLLLCGGIIGLPVALIAVQPDLGTALVVGFSGAFCIFMAGLAWRRIALLVGIAAVLAPLGWPLLREYHRERFLTFLDPEADPLGLGWNIIQSKIAVGSGGVFGKGWGEGTQSRLDFLPEHTTDFIFSVFAEEFGLMGVVGVLALFLFIIGRSLFIVAQSRDTYARLVGSALAMTFFLFVLLNSGMISGVLPVIGVPMPLMSYGGTSAVSLLAGFGIIMSVNAHRRFMGE
ncbi:rod shape-determining protein RodA [Aquimonas sp.]|jgi:rod shape determining protein RodA|uniref:rod shape-determining protein RodA n=1 Tax=Aquimonas sp. TaxID=1872588 RepID=UPI0037C04455